MLLREWFGEAGIVAAAALAGFVDAQAAAISVATLVATGKMSAADAVLPILAGLSTNSISKMILADTAGGRSFAFRVIPGSILVALAAWAGALSFLFLGMPKCVLMRGLWLSRKSRRCSASGEMGLT